MSRQRHQRAFPKWIFFCLLLPVMLLGMPAMGLTFEGEVELIAGFDDNVTESPKATGLGFTGARVEGVQPLLNEAAPVNAAIGMEGTYRQYFSPERSYQTSIFTRMEGKFWRDRLYPVLKFSGGIFRNENIPQDDADWLEARLHVDGLVHARFTLGAEVIYARLDYQNPISSLHFPSMSDAGGTESALLASRFPAESGVLPSIASAERTEMKRYQDSREDHSLIGQLIGSLFMGPQATLSLIFEHGKNRSTIKQKAYELNGISTDFSWKPGRNWQTGFLLAYQKIDYSKAPNLLNRIDHSWGGGLKISRFFGMFELYFQLEWLKNDSSVPTESYTKRVTQCGVTYLF
jgi:hypothetical protein